MRNHHVIIEVLAPGYAGEREERFYCSGPIIALNELHRLIQNHQVIAADRRTMIRPKLKPDQYRIVRFFEKYIDSAGAAVESNFDLPNSGNPDVVDDMAEKRAAKKAANHAANFFAFFEGTKGEKPIDPTLPAQA